MKELQIPLSISLMKSPISHVIVDELIHLKMFFVDCQIPTFLFINFIKIGHGHKIGQSVIYPLVNGYTSMYIAILNGKQLLLLPVCFLG